MLNNPHFSYTKEDCQFALDAIEKTYNPCLDSNRATAYFCFNIKDRIRYIRKIGLKADTSTVNELLNSPKLIEDGLNRLPSNLIEDVLGMHLLGQQKFGHPFDYEYLLTLKEHYPQSQYLKYLDEIIALQRIGVVLPENVSDFVSCKTDQEKLTVENENTPLPNTIKELIGWLNGRKAFIDIWSPRCKPCIEELKQHAQTSYSLQMLGYTPVFISLNTDNTMKQMWVHRITEDRVTGYHISAGKELNKELTALFGNSIPKYVVIGANGEILSKDAPRPSDPTFMKVLSSYK